jgi:hypothetical protein
MLQSLSDRELLTLTYNLLQVLEVFNGEMFHFRFRNVWTSYLYSVYVLFVCGLCNNSTSSSKYVA